MLTSIPPPRPNTSNLYQITIDRNKQNIQITRDLFTYPILKSVFEQLAFRKIWLLRGKNAHPEPLSAQAWWDSWPSASSSRPSWWLARFWNGRKKQIKDPLWSWCQDLGLSVSFAERLGLKAQTKPLRNATPLPSNGPWMIGMRLRVFFSLPKPGGEPGIFSVFMLIISLKQSLRPLGYCAPYIRQE